MTSRLWIWVTPEVAEMPHTVQEWVTATTGYSVLFPQVDCSSFIIFFGHNSPGMG